MDRWKFEKLEVEGCDGIATRETAAEREQVKKEAEMLGKVLPFFGVELLEEGAEKAVTMLQREGAEREKERGEKGKMMREIEREMRRRGNRLAQGKKEGGGD